MEKKVCKNCGNVINKERVYCNNNCRLSDFIKMTIERNKSNTGKSWDEIMGVEASQRRKNKKSKQMRENNVSSRPEVANKISNSLHKHRQQNPLKGEKNPFYGKKHSDETKKKLSEDKKGKWAYNEEQYQKLFYIKHQKKKITQIGMGVAQSSHIRLSSTKS